jgi:hypothetical protein
MNNVKVQPSPYKFREFCLEVIKMNGIMRLKIKYYPQKVKY